MSKPIVFSENALANMLEDLKEAFPNEGCGFLFGHDTEKREISVAQKVINSKEGDQKRRFEIKPTDYMKAEMYADENNLSLLGIYHSHPNHPARPSEYDLERAFPYFSYIIVSVMEGKIDHITSWQLDDKGEFQEEIIEKESINIK